MKLPSQKIAGAFGAGSGIVLILSMFLDWYKLDLPSRVAGRTINVPTYTAFEALERSDVYILVAAVLGILFAGMLIARVLADSPAPALVLLAAGLFAFALIVYRGTSRPEKLLFGSTIDTTLQFGWFIALLAAASMTIVGGLAYLAGPRLQLEPDELEDEEETEPQPASGRAGQVAGETPAAEGTPEPGRDA
jgi:hypothetical protein